MRFFAAFCVGVLAMSAAAPAAELPLFDVHLHYSHDAVEQLPPTAAAEIMRKAGLRRAMVSSSDDDGTQKLLEAAPEIVVPSLRPYRRRSDTAGWTNDPTLIDYVEGRLKKFKYRALGEFHAYGADIDKPVVQRMIALAREYNLLLHAHSDANAIERIFKTWPDAKVLWAHSGFDRPDKVRDMLKTYPNLWCDLAFRTDQASGTTVAPEWKTVFEAFPNRFMIGTDTFTPERWHYIGAHAAYSRGWISTLPTPLAEGIAYRNAEAMLESIAPLPPARSQ